MSRAGDGVGVGAAGAEDGEEVFASHTGADEPDGEFDRAVGALQDAVMDQTFRDSIDSFCRSHCGEFELGTGGDPMETENSLEHMDLFQRFTAMIEERIAVAVESAVPGMGVEQLAELMEARADELTDDVFDLLAVLGDFMEFKSLMISWRMQLEHERAVPTDAAAAGGAAAAAAADGEGVPPVAPVRLPPLSQQPVVVRSESGTVNRDPWAWSPLVLDGHSVSAPGDDDGGDGEDGPP